MKQRIKPGHDWLISSGPVPSLSRFPERGDLLHQPGDCSLPKGRGQASFLVTPIGVIGLLQACPASPRSVRSSVVPPRGGQACGMFSVGRNAMIFTRQIHRLCHCETRCSFRVEAISSIGQETASFLAVTPIGVVGLLHYSLLGETRCSSRGESPVRVIAKPGVLSGLKQSPPWARKLLRSSQ